MNIERKLGTIRKIDAIRKIENADSIECAVLDGWEVVVKKDEFKVGDKVLYLEIDTFVPHELAPFLTKEGKEPAEYKGVKGQRLRTVRLRNQISQGLVIPIPDGITEKTDIDKKLGLIKWEPEIPASLKIGDAKGSFPSYISKSDQPRCLFEDTLIDTSDGIFSIKEICDKRMKTNVKSFNHITQEIEFKPIINHSIMKNKDEFIKINLSDNNYIIVTKKHKIWVENIQAYREAQYIQPGDIFLIS